MISLPLNPELKTLNRLHLPFIRAVKVCLRFADMKIDHEALDHLKIVPFRAHLSTNHLFTGQPVLRFHPLIFQAKTRSSLPGFYGQDMLYVQPSEIAPARRVNRYFHLRMLTRVDSLRRWITVRNEHSVKLMRGYRAVACSDWLVRSSRFYPIVRLMWQAALPS